MDELLVEWTLIKCKEFVEEKFEKELGRAFGKLNLVHQQFSDENGRIDLIYSNENKEILLVELETGIDNLNKYNFCMEQTKRYMKMGPVHFSGRKCYSIIFYAKDITPEKFERLLEQDAKKEGILLARYSLEEVQKIHEEEVKRISRNMGLLLSTPVSAMPYTLSSINRFLSAFIITRKDKLYFEEIQKALLTSKGKNKGKPWSKTSVNEHKYLLEGMGAILVEKVGRKTIFVLKNIGKKLIENMNKIGIPFHDMSLRESSIPLSIEQKRIILEELMKDNFEEVPKYKSMILLFMRFLMMTGGIWVPKQRNYAFDKGQMKFLNLVLGTNFSNTTNMGNIMTWSRNYCEELGLIEVIKLKGGVSKAAITTIGSRVFHVLETTQHIKREIIQIPQQVIG